MPQLFIAHQGNEPAEPSFTYEIIMCMHMSAIKDNHEASRE